MKKRFTVLALILFCSASFAHAQTADELRAQIAQLLAQIESIRAQLGVSTEQTTSGPTPTSSTTSISTSTSGSTFNYSGCPNLQYNLERNDTDAATAQEVSMLQRFLAQDTQLYPEKIVSGYFGTLTEKAVQRYQLRHGIVQTGDYQSTGYGRVGPRTRHAIAKSCAAITTQTTSTITPTTPTTPSTQYGTLVVTPWYGTSPLQVTATIENPTASACTSYEIDWGDIAAPIRYDAPQYANCNTNAFRRTFTHTYAAPGTFTVRAKVGNASLSALPEIKKDIVVYGGTIATNGNDSCFISPREGSAPLSVEAKILLGGTLCDGNLAYYIDWGDGEISETNHCTDQNSHYETLSHTYTTSGTRTARLLQSHPNALFAESTCTVSISTKTPTNISGGTTDGVPDACKVWYDGCNTCTRAYAGGPLACTMMACVLAPGTPPASERAYCKESFLHAPSDYVSEYTGDSLSATITSASARSVSFTATIAGDGTCADGAVYTIYFGDTSDVLLPNTTSCGIITRTASHTYATSGTYSASLMRNGVIVDTITVTVGNTSQSKATNLAAAYRASSADVILRAIDAIEKVLQMLFK